MVAATYPVRSGREPSRAPVRRTGPAMGEAAVGQAARATTGPRPRRRPPALRSVQASTSGRGHPAHHLADAAVVHHVAGPGARVVLGGAHLGDHHRAVVAAAVAVGVARGHEARPGWPGPGRRGRGRPRPGRCRWAGGWAPGVVISWWCRTTNTGAGGLAAAVSATSSVQVGDAPGPAVGTGGVHRHDAQPGHVAAPAPGRWSRPSRARPWPGESRGGVGGRGRRPPQRVDHRPAGLPGVVVAGDGQHREPRGASMVAEAVPVGLASRVGEVALGHQQLGAPRPRSRPPRPGRPAPCRAPGHGRRLGHAAQEAEALLAQVQVGDGGEAEQLGSRGRGQGPDPAGASDPGAAASSEHGRPPGPAGRPPSCTEPGPCRVEVRPRRTAPRPWLGRDGHAPPRAGARGRAR